VKRRKPHSIDQTRRASKAATGEPEVHFASMGKTFSGHTAAEAGLFAPTPYGLYGPLWPLTL